MVLCSIFDSEKHAGGSSLKGKAVKVLMRLGVSEDSSNSWADEAKILQVVAQMGLSGVLPAQFLAFLLSLSYPVGRSADLSSGTPTDPPHLCSMNCDRLGFICTLSFQSISLFRFDEWLTRWLPSKQFQIPGLR